MPHIPTPPTPTGMIISSASPPAVNIHQPNSNIAQQIKDVAEQQALYRNVCRTYRVSAIEPAG